MLASLELGYFADEGINLELRQFPTTVPVMNAVAAKEIDIGGGGVFPLVIANQPGEQHMPIRFFYNGIRKFAFEIVVLPESPLKNIADLKGKKLGLLSLTAPYASVTRVVLRENGLSPDDVELVPTGENRGVFEQLLNGEIDAYETFIGNSARFEAEGHELRRLPYDARISNLITYSYYAHEDMIKAKPDILSGFGRAAAKGIITCNVNPEWCVKTLWKHYPHLKPAPEKTDQEMARLVFVLRKILAAYLAFPEEGTRRFGEYPASAFPDLVDVLHEGGELPSADIDTSLYYTNEFVEAINGFDVEAVEAKARTLQ